jgi:acyl-coenzyme A synthetase/AMP-(fatty) acid ligase/acyl carrier protein
MLDHKGPVNTLADINRRFAVGERDRVLALSALNFDLSVYDIFGLLAAGGAVVLPDPSALRDPDHWAELVEREQVTLWDTVPALMEMLVDRAEQRGGGALRSLRAVLMSGDWIPVTLPDRIKRLLPGAAVTSLGGATEASIWSILYPIGEVDPSWRSIPYGRPMGNQRFYVLDPALEPCPVGVEGALYIGGVGLAKGYWREQALTAASFIDLPSTGERLYRTGDLGRYLPDGTIEFLGRKDFQVKIRGFRIELGEIEATLMAHAGVREAVALAREDTPGDKRLVAYVVPHASASLEASALRDHLRDRLPEYMVPPAILLLEEMPLTSNGKVDRRALPAPEGPSAEGRPFVAPRNRSEEVIAAVWAEVLGLDRVSVHDNFFDLGGHSLLATQVVSRVREAFSVDLSLRQFFAASTLEELAISILGARADLEERAETEELLAELEGLSEEEALALLNADGISDEGDDV